MVVMDDGNKCEIGNVKVSKTIIVVVTAKEKIPNIRIDENKIEQSKGERN